MRKADVETDPANREKLNAFRERAKQIKPDSHVHRVYATFDSLEEFSSKAIQAVAVLRRYLDEQSKPVTQPQTPTPTITEISEEISHKRALIRELRRRLRVLEVQIAKVGTFAPPYIYIEAEDTKISIEQIEKEIQLLQEQVVKHTSNSSSTQDISLSLSAEAPNRLPNSSNRVSSSAKEILDSLILSTASKRIYRESPLSILLIGMTGPGKSSTINTVIGKEFAATGYGRPITDEISMYQANIRGIDCCDCHQRANISICGQITALDIVVYANNSVQTTETVQLR